MKQLQKVLVIIYNVQILILHVPAKILHTDICYLSLIHRQKKILKNKVARKRLGSYWVMISWSRLCTITHIARCPKWKIDIATTRTSPVIFPTPTCNHKQLKPLAQKKNNMNYSIHACTFKVWIESSYYKTYGVLHPRWQESSVTTHTRASFILFKHYY